MCWFNKYLEKWGGKEVMTPATCKYITTCKELPYGTHDPLMKCHETVISPILSGANFWKRAGDMSRIIC